MKYRTKKNDRKTDIALKSDSGLEVKTYFLVNNKLFFNVNKNIVNRSFLERLSGLCSLYNNVINDYDSIMSDEIFGFIWNTKYKN